MKKRESNFELLRIIGMFLIISNHYAIHGWPNYGSLELSTFSMNTFLIQFIGSFGKSGATIFVLISGYFLINANIKYNKLVPLVSKMFFYSYSILFIIFFLKITPITEKNFFNALFPIFGKNWFIVNYLLVYLILPFINPFLKSLKKITYAKMLFVFIIIWSILPSISDYTWNFSAIEYFVVLYCIGGYIKLHFIQNYKNKYNLLLAISCALLILLYIFISDYISIKTGNQILLNNHMDFIEINSFIPVMFSIFLFLYFKEIKLSNRLINYISSSSLGIYLIHDNNIIRHLVWSDLLPNTEYMNSQFMILHFIFKILVVFITSLIIDKIYTFTIKKYIIKFFTIIYNFFENRISSVWRKLWKDYLSQD